MAKHKIPMYGGRWGNHENPLGPRHLQPSAMREPISSSAMSYITETISVIMNFCVTTGATRSELSREGVHHWERPPRWVPWGAQQNFPAWGWSLLEVLPSIRMLYVRSLQMYQGWERNIRELADALRTNTSDQNDQASSCVLEKTAMKWMG